MTSDSLDKIAEGVPETTEEQEETRSDRVQSEDFEDRDTAEYEGGL